MTSKLQQLLAERRQMVTRAKTIKPESGRNRYRILPSWRGPDEQFWMDFGQHFVKDATGKIKAVFVCDDRTFGKPCDVCMAIEAGIKSAEDDLTINQLKDAKAGSRVLLNVLELTEGKADYNNPKILEVAPTVFNGKNGVGGILSLMGEWPNLVNLNDGIDIIVEKSGSGKEGTSYGVQIAGGSKPVNPEVAKKVTNLDDFVKNETEESARRALTAVASISGALPPPATARLTHTPTATPSTPLPADASMPRTVAQDLDASQEAALRALENAQPAPATPAPTVTATPAPAAPPATPAANSGDAELDKLLASL